MDAVSVHLCSEFKCADRQGVPFCLQVAAVAALMEGVRGWEDSGNFNVQLFDETCESMCYRNTSPEALSFFISKYLDCPDVG